MAKHHMRDIGKMRNSMDAPMTAGEGKKEKYYPKIDFTDAQLPPLKNKKMDDKVTIRFNGIIKDVHEDYSNKEDNAYEIEIREAEIVGGVSEKEYMDRNEDGRDA